MIATMPDFVPSLHTIAEMSRLPHVALKRIFPFPYIRSSQCTNVTAEMKFFLNKLCGVLSSYLIPHRRESNWASVCAVSDNSLYSWLGQPICCIKTECYIPLHSEFQRKSLALVNKKTPVQHSQQNTSKR